MFNDLGNYSLCLCTLVSLYLIYYSFKELQNKTKILSNNLLSTLSLQFFLILLSFLCLIYLFISSDFSNVTVFNNSHTAKPLFYKISGTWGNHEGSLLLWLLVLTFFIILYSITSKHLSTRYRLFTIIFQEIIILGFLLFIIFVSNPFAYIYPVPEEGMGLNPILQDPALAIHPPILYFGYVGSSIIFSASLAAAVTNNLENKWAAHIKNWIFVSWIFLTIGILLGSIWAYYELGWGGFWFWDPVENVSLMPWFCLTALFHSIIVLQKRNILKSWVVILSIGTFILSLGGTFLVRSGILNSVHTFANDPSRGLFILIFLFLLVILSLTIFFIYLNKENTSNNKTYFFSKETLILINNWFLMYFLSVVLIGTTYPIFLEVINDNKISVGPPFYQKLIVPFLIPFLFFMAVGPKIKWIKDNFKKINLTNLIFLILSSILAFLIVEISETKYLFASILFAFAILLFFITIKDVFDDKLKFAQKISHLGFSILILSILINGILSREITSNMKVGDKLEFMNKTLLFKSIKKKEKQNYKVLEGKFILGSIKGDEEFYPEIRIYKKPKIFTSEADIKINFFEDNFLVFNLINEDNYFNVRYQFKPFMLWIWLSTLTMAIGGILTFIRK